MIDPTDCFFSKFQKDLNKIHTQKELFELLTFENKLPSVTHYLNYENYFLCNDFPASSL